MIDESVAAIGCITGLGKRRKRIIGVKVSTGNGKAFIALLTDSMIGMIGSVG